MIPKNSMASSIVKPKISEKAAFLSEQGKYVFVIAQRATAPEVKKEVRQRYGVDAVDVHIINKKGKMKGRGRMLGRQARRRSAIVTLAKGQTIDIAS